jgi:hypothetical protein
MQIRRAPKPLGMTGLSSGLDTANWPWTHQYRARVPPWGVNRADALCVSTSNFSTKKSPLKFFHQNSDHHDQPPPTLIERRRAIIQYEWIWVSIGDYG